MRLLRKFAILALALAPVVAGCSDGKDQQKPVVVWALPAAVAGIKGGPIEQIVPPPAVVAWGGADDAEKLGAGAQAFLAQVSPLMPNILDAARDELRRKMALTRLDGVDWKRPARVAVFDPKGTPKASLAVMITLAN